MKTFLKRVLFYFLSFTWGIIMTFFGAIAMIIFAFMGRVKTYHGRLYAHIGEGWGGVSLGCFFICSDDCQEDYIQSHECGHGLQNIIWGPLFLFVVAIPSFARYWYREWVVKTGRKQYGQLPAYDDIWFEDQATKWGEKYIETNQW